MAISLIVRIFFFLLILWSMPVYAQSVENTIQNWFDFNGSYIFDEHWKAYGDAGYRIILDNETLHRFYVRPAGSLQLSDIFILHAGLGFFITFNQEKTLREIRPFQGLTINWPTFPSIPISQYIRFEERFFSDDKSSTLIYRGRYQIGTKIRLSENKNEKYLYIPLQLEWFVNWKSNLNFRANEFRAVAGLGIVFDKSWRFEFNTILQSLKASLDEIYTFHDVIFRFRLYKEFNPNS